MKLNRASGFFKQISSSPYSAGQLNYVDAEQYLIQHNDSWAYVQPWTNPTNATWYIQVTLKKRQGTGRLAKNQYRPSSTSSTIRTEGPNFAKYNIYVRPKLTM